MEFDPLSRKILDAAFDIHDRLGPGLLESVYEQVLAAKLERDGLRVQRQRPIDILFDDIRFEGAFRADLIVGGRLLIELKSIEQLGRVHAKQVITYLRLTGLPVGLLINFGGAVLNGNIKRLTNER